MKPLVPQFGELAPEWGLDNSGRIAVVLRALLSCVISGGNQQAKSPKVHCWIERTPEGPFKITAEDEGAGYFFACLDTMMSNNPLAGHRGNDAILRRLCRNMQINAQGNRVTVLVDANGPVRTRAELLGT